MSHIPILSFYQLQQHTHVDTQTKTRANIKCKDVISKFSFFPFWCSSACCK